MEIRTGLAARGRLQTTLTLEAGVTLPITVAYETYGRPNAARDNAVLICHALTGDAHAAGLDPLSEPGWWQGLVGVGRTLDPERDFIVCSNVLGGCQGTTGPASLDDHGQPWGSRFPRVTVRDMVQAQEALRHALGIPAWHLVLGGSLGGMQALEWAASFPERVERCVVIAAPAATSAQSIAWNEVQRQVIYTDPAWQGGDYVPGQGPARGLAVARMLAMITYQSFLGMEAKFGREPARGVDELLERLGAFATAQQAELKYQVQNYLHYQGEKLVRRFEANSYVRLTQAMDDHDVGRGRGGLEAALERITARCLVVGIDTDLLYPAAQVRELAAALERAGVTSRYAEMRSPWGHDAFLIDTVQLSDIIGQWVQETTLQEVKA